MPVWKFICKLDLFMCYLDMCCMPCHLSAVFSGLSGPLVTKFYFKDKAQKERTANKSFLTEPGKMINCKTIGFGAEDVVAPVVECLPNANQAWVHLQHCTNWVYCPYKLSAQKQKEVGSEVQGQLQLPREFPGRPGIHEAMGEGSRT